MMLLLFVLCSVFSRRPFWQWLRQCAGCRGNDKRWQRQWQRAAHTHNYVGTSSITKWEWRRPRAAATFFESILKHMEMRPFQPKQAIFFSCLLLLFFFVRRCLSNFDFPKNSFIFPFARLIFAAAYFSRCRRTFFFFVHFISRRFASILSLLSLESNLGW